MKKKKTWILLGSLLISAVLAGFLVLKDLQLVVRLNAGQLVYLEYGSSFEPSTLQVSLKSSHIYSIEIPVHNAQITVKTDIQDNLLGEYTVTYYVQYGLWKGSAEQNVFVIDTQSPVIELISAEDLPEEPEGHFEEPGFKATDNYDGDITDRVIRIESPKLVTYSVVDSSGNPASIEREIPYYDTFPPEIQLEGGEEYSITLGKPYEEPGYSATDDTDGDLTESVVVHGKVDWLNPGVYPVVYSVADSCGNEVRVTRNVRLEAAQWPDTQWPEEKTIYLTFDDGPGPYTAQLLEILDRYNVKATFFVVDSGEYQLMQEIVQRGHSIGIHSVTHNYSEIYASPEAYFADVYAMQQIIYDHTGVKTTLLRFPGGGSNLVSRNTSEGIMTTLTWAVRNAGFQYFDWNVDSEDASGATSAAKVTDNVIRGIQEAGTCMVLQHDIHPYSVAAVEEIILWGLNNGYQFASVCASTPGFHHDVMN